MKVELTLAQLHKVSRLSPESWKTLLIFVKQGGSGDFTPDLHPLREAGLVSKVGPCAYVKFMVDGALPTQLPHAAKRNKNTSEFGAFMAIWRRNAPDTMLTGSDLGALKRFVANYSLEEFTDMVHRYVGNVNVATMHGMWAGRSKYGKAKVNAFSGREE